MLQWMEECGLWEYTKTDFYEQYEFSLLGAPLPAQLRCLVGQEYLAAIAQWLSSFLGAPRVELVDVVAHLMIEGQGIGIHNDYRTGGETHRLLIQLGRGVTGGVTAILRSHVRDSVRRLLRPMHNTALAMGISDRSFHAVTTVQSGRRFTLVYSFKPSCGRL
ncbi:MAG: 2OG-Fe(II) oxygenase [Gammaproteobacteria bacterium]|nr:2OG-Fe(II) oxygenase [Gammaproteobacteria bacterium]